MSQDVVALIFSFIYVFAMIGLAELLRRWRGYGVDFTRKFIHVAVGMWSWGTVALFDRAAWAVIPPLAFVLINAASHVRGTFKAMESGEKWQLGTIYFPISFAAVIWLFWGRPALLVAALMPMTWGDALAAVIGQRNGQRRYRVLGSNSSRSVEGSMVMFGASWLATALALGLLGQPVLGIEQVLGWSALVAAGSTVAEGLSPWGTDNLTVPAVCVLILALLGSGAF